MTTQEQMNQSVMGTYGRFPVVIDHGAGESCADETGKQYIDFGSGIGTTSLGYCIEAWTEAVCKQVKTMQHTSNLYYTKVQADFAQKLCQTAGYEKVFFCNSGAEANECAIKLARKYSFDKYGKGRHKILTLVNSFHGRTLCTLSATGQDVFHNYFFPFVEGFGYVTAYDIDDLEAMLDGTIPPESERQYLQISSEECRRLSRMVRRMLDVSQLQAIDPLRGGNHFDICESMRRVLISMEKKINDRHLDVDADIPEEPILVLGDNDMITQVIYNLLENATKFARSGSTLYLGVATIDGKARVTVRNVGDTIPAEELPLLFERFHKSDKSRSEDKDGVGLGLYIVKTILEQHRQKISVTSEDGVTTFTFSLATD